MPRVFQKTNTMTWNIFQHLQKAAFLKRWMIHSHLFASSGWGSQHLLVELWTMNHLLTVIWEAPSVSVSSVWHSCLWLLVCDVFPFSDIYIIFIITCQKCTRHINELKSLQWNYLLWMSTMQTRNLFCQNSTFFSSSKYLLPKSQSMSFWPICIYSQF